MKTIELSLVPDVKAKLIRQEKIRNFVVFICIIAGIGCGVIIVALLGVVGTYTALLSGADKEIACRIDRTSKNAKGCGSGYKTPIMQTENLNSMLSIQNELNNIGELNANKTNPSRLLPTDDSLRKEPARTPMVFSLLEVILPNSDEYSFKTSELSIDFAQSQINYDVVAEAKNSKAQATAYANFAASINASYFDYGDYYGQDKDGVSFKIPSYCITDEVIIDGNVYGKYSRYAAGCEAMMVVDTMNQDEEYLEKVRNAKPEETVYIRRTYKNQEDFEAYKKGNNRSDNANVANEAPTGFYFESNCLEYNSDGEFDENASAKKCPIVSETFEGTDKAEGYVNDKRVFSFSVPLSFSPEIFKQSSHNVLFYSPSRRNVSDSYRAVKDFFTKSFDDIQKEEK